MFQKPKKLSTFIVMGMNRIFWVVLVFAFAKAHSQNTTVNTSADKPKIGLVLSGGGAKGLAHVGALKVIDSLGIQIDYIAGTSMGAIVGSLYASGYTGKQLDSIFRTLKFDNLIADEIPRASKTFYERKENERYAVTLPFKDFKIAIPNSISKGQNFYNLLSQLLTHVKDVNDFRDLPIPFFCVATDVETGKEMVLDKGSLPKALNASSAIPSLFAPVEIGDQVLIDGGVTDNYPVEKLRARGMDIIIGVDVQDDLKTREELLDAFDILVQINNYRTINAMRTKKELTDIYIQPDINNYTIMSFDKGVQIIKQGEIATNSASNELNKLKTPNYKKPTLNSIRTDSIYISQVSINGNKNYTESYIKGRFKVRIPGMVAYTDIRNGINNLQATNNFSKINYELVTTADGTALEINIIETAVRNYLRLGIHYDELFRSAALINLSRKKVLFDNDIVSADLILGDNLRYNFDYYIDKGRYWSIGIHSEFTQFEKQINVGFANELSGIVPPDLNSIEVDYNDWTQQVYVQNKLENGFYVRLGVEHKSLNIFTETVITPSPEDDKTVFEDSNFTSLYGNVLLDSYDNAFFPNTGWRVDGDLHLYLYSTDFTNTFNEFSVAQLSIGHAHSFGKLSLQADVLTGLPIGDPGNSSLDFFLGGYRARRLNNILPFFGYDFVSIAGDSIFRILFEVDYEIFKKNHIVFSANLASVDDNLFEQSKWFRQARYTGYAIGYGLETFLGPIELKYAFSPQQDQGEFYVNLGFRF